MYIAWELRSLWHKGGNSTTYKGDDQEDPDNKRPGGRKRKRDAEEDQLNSIHSKWSDTFANSRLHPTLQT